METVFQTLVLLLCLLSRNVKSQNMLVEISPLNDPPALDAASEMHTSKQSVRHLLIANPFENVRKYNQLSPRRVPPTTTTASAAADNVTSVTESTPTIPIGTPSSSSPVDDTTEGTVTTHQSVPIQLSTPSTLEGTIQATTPKTSLIDELEVMEQIIAVLQSGSLQSSHTTSSSATLTSSTPKPPQTTNNNSLVQVDLQVSDSSVDKPLEGTSGNSSVQIVNDWLVVKPSQVTNGNSVAQIGLQTVMTDSLTGTSGNSNVPNLTDSLGDKPHQVSCENSTAQIGLQTTMTESLVGKPSIIPGNSFLSEPIKPPAVIQSSGMSSAPVDSLMKPNGCTCYNVTVVLSELPIANIPGGSNLPTSYLQVQSSPPYSLLNQINEPSSISVIQKPMKKPFIPAFLFKKPIKFASPLIKPLYWKLSKTGLLKVAAIPIAIATALGVAGSAKKAVPVSEHVELEYQTPPKYVYPPIPIAYSPIYYSAPKKPSYASAPKAKPSYERVPKKQRPKNGQSPINVPK